MSSIQETYLTPFVNGMQTIAERFIQIAQFDKTVIAEIAELDNEDSHHFLVSTLGCKRLSVRSFESDNNKYKIKDNVYITVPNGDYNSSNKYILGKVNKSNYIFDIQEIEDILVMPCQQTTDFNAIIDNANRYSTLIIKFTPKVNCNIINDNKQNIILKETVFPFNIYGTIKGNTQNITNFWSTRNLYGNIFNSLIPCTQYIYISNLQDFENIQIVWDYLQQDNIPIFTYQDQETGNFAKVSLENITYYYGYAIADFDKNENNGATIVLTHSGPQIFCRNSYYFDHFDFLEKELGQNTAITLEKYSEYWPNQEQAFNYMIDLQNKYISTEEIYNNWNSFPVELDALSDLYNWHIDIYRRNYLLQEQQNKYIPPFWELIKTYEQFKDKDFDLSIYDNQYINQSYYNCLASLVCSWIEYDNYENLSKWYDDQYKSLIQDLSISQDEYLEKLNKLHDSFITKIDNITKQQVIYDILE